MSSYQVNENPKTGIRTKLSEFFNSPVSSKFSNTVEFKKLILESKIKLHMIMQNYLLRPFLVSLKI